VQAWPLAPADKLSSLGFKGQALPEGEKFHPWNLQKFLKNFFLP
jgi:hypothetical protein